jgi:hypothetical protein
VPIAATGTGHAVSGLLNGTAFWREVGSFFDSLKSRFPFLFCRKARLNREERIQLVAAVLQNGYDAVSEVLRASPLRPHLRIVISSRESTTILHQNKLGVSSAFSPTSSVLEIL